MTVKLQWTNVIVDSATATVIACVAGLAVLFLKRANEKRRSEEHEAETASLICTVHLPSRQTNRQLRRLPLQANKSNLSFLFAPTIMHFITLLYIRKNKINK